MQRVAKSRVPFYPARFGIEIDDLHNNPYPSDATTPSSPKSRSHPVAPSENTSHTSHALLQDVEVLWPDVFLESASSLYPSSAQRPTPSPLPSLAYPCVVAPAVVNIFPLSNQEPQKECGSASAPSTPSTSATLFPCATLAAPCTTLVREAQGEVPTLNRDSGTLGHHKWPQISPLPPIFEPLLGSEPLTSLCFSPHLHHLNSAVQDVRSRVQLKPLERAQSGVDQVNRGPWHPSLGVDEASDSPLPLVHAPVSGAGVLASSLATPSDADAADEEWCALKAFLSEPLPNHDNTVSELPKKRRADARDNNRGQTEINATTFNNSTFSVEEQLHGALPSASATPLLQPHSTRQQQGLVTNGCDQAGLGDPVKSRAAVLQVHHCSASVLEEVFRCGLLPPSHSGHLIDRDRERDTHRPPIDQVHATPNETPYVRHLLHRAVPISEARPHGPAAGEVNEGQLVNTRAIGGGRVDQVNAGQGHGKRVGVGIPRTEDGEVIPSHVRGAMFQSWMHIGVEMWDMGLTLGLDRILHQLVHAGGDPETLSPSSPGRGGERDKETAVHADTTLERRDPCTDSLAPQHEEWVPQMGGEDAATCQDPPPAMTMPESAVQHMKFPGKRGGMPLSLVRSTEGHDDRDGPHKNATEDGSPLPSASRVSLSQRLACTLQAIQAQKLRKRKQDETPRAIGEGQGTPYPVVKAAHALPPVAMAGSLTTPQRTLAHLGGLSTQAGKSARVEASCAREGKLPMILPQPLPPQGIEVNMKRRLLLAAAALEAGNKEAFYGLCSQLKPHGKKAGTASQRFAHLMLRALHLRERGNVYEFLKNSTRSTYKDLHNAYMWGYTSTPIVPFSIISSITMLLPKLLGHSRVHLISIGDAFLPHVPTLMRLLVAFPGLRRTRQGKNGTASVDQPSRGLRSFRLTSVNYGNLFRPERREVKAVKARSEIDIFLRDVAKSLGVSLEFRLLDIDELNGSSLRSVTPRPREVVGVCACQILRFASDEAPICALQETLQCLARVNPVIIAFSDEDCEGNSRDFLPRFSAVMDFTWTRMHSHDAVTSPANKSNKTNLLWYEQFWFAPNVFKALSCERRDRRVRPRSSLGWKHTFVSAGFRPVTVGYPLLQGALRLLESYPVGFQLCTMEENVVLYWKGSPLACACGFEPQ